MGESKAAEKDEVNVENEMINKAGKEAKANKAAMTQRMANMMNNDGRRATQCDNNMDDQDGEILLEDIAQSAFDQ